MSFTTLSLLPLLFFSFVALRVLFNLWDIANGRSSTERRRRITRRRSYLPDLIITRQVLEVARIVDDRVIKTSFIAAVPASSTHLLALTHHQSTSILRQLFSNTLNLIDLRIPHKFSTIPHNNPSQCPATPHPQPKTHQPIHPEEKTRKNAPRRNRIGTTRRAARGWE